MSDEEASANHGGSSQGLGPPQESWGGPRPWDEPPQDPGPPQDSVPPQDPDPPQDPVPPQPHGLQELAVLPLPLGNPHSHCSLVLAHGSLLDFRGDAIVNAANEGGVSGFGVDEAVNKAAGFEMIKQRKKFGGIRTGEAEWTAGYAHDKVRYVVHAVGPVYRRNAFRDNDKKRLGPPEEEDSRGVLGEQARSQGASAKPGAHPSRSSDSPDAPDPPWHSQDRLLVSAYRSALSILSEELGCESAAFALLSAGVFRGERGLEEVLRIGVQSVMEWLEEHHEHSVAATSASASGTTTTTLQRVYMVAYTDAEREALSAIAEEVCDGRSLQGDGRGGGP